MGGVHVFPRARASDRCEATSLPKPGWTREASWKIDPAETFDRLGEGPQEWWGLLPTPPLLLNLMMWDHEFHIMER